MFPKTGGRGAGAGEMVTRGTENRGIHGNPPSPVINGEGPLKIGDVYLKG